MAAQLNGKTVALLATDGVEQVELTQPRDALEEAGATTHLVAPESGEIQSFAHHDKGDRLKVDATLADASVQDYDALVLPGGVINPDILRMDDAAVAFVRAFMQAGKPVAAICHGPWTLVEANVVSGRTLTSWPSLQTDIRNAGGEWVDEEVVVDDHLITSRKPDDLKAFCDQLIEQLGRT